MCDSFSHSLLAAFAFVPLDPGANNKKSIHTRKIKLKQEHKTRTALATVHAYWMALLAPLYPLKPN